MLVAMVHARQINNEMHGTCGVNILESRHDLGIYSPRKLSLNSCLAADPIPWANSDLTSHKSCNARALFQETGIGSGEISCGPLK